MKNNVLKNIYLSVSSNLYAVLLIALIFVFSAFIFNQKEIIELSNVPAFKGENVEIDQWKSYYGGGQGLDEVVTIDENSIYVSSGADGGWYGARSEISPIDFTEKSLRFYFRFEDPKDVKSFLIILGSDSGELQNYFSFNIKNYFSNPEADQWHEVVISKSDFEVAEGNPDWANITDVAIRLIGEPAVATKVWIDGLSTVDIVGEPMISMTFDDGFDSVIEAKEIMDRYQISGTLFIIPEFINTPGYLSQDNVDVLHQGGWDISGHSKFNLREFEYYGDLDTELALVVKYLYDNDYRGKEHFAYPNGSYNDSVRGVVSEYFQTARTIDGFSQPQGYIMPSKINSKTVSVNTSVDEIKKWIDDSINENSWLILTWHDIEENPITDTEYSIEGFEEIVDYAVSKEVEILPYSSAYKRTLVN